MKLFLVFINEIGKDWEGKYIYEFIFSDSIEGIDGDNWDEYPAAGLPSPPTEAFVKQVGRIEGKLRLELIQESDTFALWDAVDGIVALAWENIDEYDQYPENRTYFSFGDPIKDVEDSLYEKDIILDYKYKKNEQIKE